MNIIQENINALKSWAWNSLPSGKQETGFTLTEVIVVTVIVGVIGAFTVPNFFSLLNRNRVDQALGEIEGALREAQKGAIRTSRSCTISIDTTNKRISNNGANDNCLLTTRNFDSEFTLTSSRNTITFSSKGNISRDPQIPVIVMSFPDGGSNQQRCVVIENTLGLIRTGDYSGTIPAVPLPDDCQ